MGLQVVVRDKLELRPAVLLISYLSVSSAFSALSKSVFFAPVEPIVPSTLTFTLATPGTSFSYPAFTVASDFSPDLTPSLVASFSVAFYDELSF